VAVPPPFRPSDPALCGSCPLVTPYYCRLKDLLYIICVVSFVLIIVHVYVCVKLFTFFDLCFVYFLQYSDTVGWVIRPVKTVGRITYIVLAQTLNHAQPVHVLTRGYQSCIFSVLQSAIELWCLYLCGTAVKASDFRASGREFDSRPGRNEVT